MQAKNRLDALETVEGYRRFFMDAEIWDVAVRQACAQHWLNCVSIRPGFPGTYPTFIVGEQWVVKFFGPLFGGKNSFAVEKALGDLLNGSWIPAPRLLYNGSIEGQAVEWNYLIFEFIPGCSIGEVYTRISQQDRVALAEWLGRLASELHKLPVPSPVSRLYPGSRSGYKRLLQTWFAARKSQDDLGLPPHLAQQCERFLQDSAHLHSTDSSLHLIHADLTRDHILGDSVNGVWQPRALIDFGDCMVGDLYYELSALHLDLFDCDMRLLEAFLKVYGSDLLADGRFPQRCLTAALQHQFNVLGVVFERHPQLNQTQSLNELAYQLWQKGQSNEPRATAAC